MSGQAIWKRNSFLKRNAGLTPAAFRAHYLSRHGPLAASQAGFRKYSLRYVQNHVEDLPDGREPLFDGITMTTQVPRADYRIGFFQEPDYANVRPDEIYLFDIARTVSVLGEVLVGPSSPQEGHKAIVLTGPDWQAPPGSLDVGLVAISRLDGANASALGFSGAAFAHPFMVECWFATGPARAAAIARAGETFGAGAVALPVREVLIFGPEMPWHAGQATPA